MRSTWTPPLAVVALLAAFPAVAAAVEPAPAVAGKEQSVLRAAENNNRFALDLYARLRTTPGNLLASPYGIASAFALAYPGAHGETAAQLARALHLGPRDDHTYAALGALAKTINDAGKAGDFQLSTANALWGQEGVELLPAYLEIVDEHFGAALRRVDFKASPDAARGVINQWVEAQTHDKIKDLLKKGDVNSSTRLVLTNAVYMKAGWAEPFAKSQTKDEPFFVDRTRRATVPMMHRTGDYNYVDAGTYAVIELPYRRFALSMAVILPKPADVATCDGVAALAEVEAEFSLDRLAQMKSANIELALPKFKFENRFALKKTLAALGVVDAFQSEIADFSGMTGRRDFSIDEAVHQTYIDVNEEGTEAAAATAIMMRSAAIRVPKPPIPFRVDHPFMFLIRETTTGCVLFTGRVTNPGG
ncbi:MAG: serpin family protein [Planctomycetota bacterium]|nr:serpin family protein [Planctomycetota bacterium]